MGIGLYLPQEASVFKKTVEENIIAVLEMTKLKRKKAKWNHSLMNFDYSM
jgi:ABC-type lipopolysaccharide export system ATPase subunit